MTEQAQMTATEAKAERAFQYYLGLGKERTLEGILGCYKKDRSPVPNISTIQRWSSKYFWQDRVKGGVAAQLGVRALNQSELYEQSLLMMQSMKEFFLTNKNIITQLFAGVVDEDGKLLDSFKLQNTNDLLKLMNVAPNMFGKLTDMMGTPDDLVGKRLLLELIENEQAAEIALAEAEGREPKMSDFELEFAQQSRKYGLKPDHLNTIQVKANTTNKVELSGKLDGPLIQMTMNPEGAFEAEEDAKTLETLDEQDATTAKA